MSDKKGSRATGLAALLAQVDADWEADAHDDESFLRCGEDGWSNDLGPGFKQEVLLAALAPHAVRLLIDMAEWIDGKGGMDEGATLLARYAELNQKATQPIETRNH